jgi:hypothetical protein
MFVEARRSELHGLSFEQSGVTLRAARRLVQAIARDADH